MSAYLCSDDTLNALSTYWVIKSGKSWDDPSKSQAFKRAMRIVNKEYFYRLMKKYDVDNYFKEND